MTRSLLFSFLALFIGLLSAAEQRVLVVSDPNLEGPARYGLDALERSLQGRQLAVRRATAVGEEEAEYYVLAGTKKSPGPAAALLSVLNVSTPQEPEALVIRRTRIADKPALLLFGSDPRGLQYAAFDAAQRISWTDVGDDPFSAIRDTDEKPYIGERAVSMYTMQRAYFESRLYDESHWRRYFDMLARSRINSFVVVFGYENGGFLAPCYPYFFNVEDFPEVRLVGITPKQQKRNVEAFRSMIRIAHERGIDFNVAIWDHIYRGGVQGGGIEGASDLAGKRIPGLVWGVTADNLAPYTKVALRQFLHTFPEIDGLQFRMHGESGLKRGEMGTFWHEIFAMIRRFKPEMRIDIRAKQLPDSIIDDGLNQGLRIRVTTKYWMEQMGLPFHPTHVNRRNQHDRRHGYADLLRFPQRYRVHWRLWNGGTTRLLLWADPDYVRRFAASARLYDGDSFEVNEMLATKMLGEPHDAPVRPIHNEPYRFYDYEFERYWHFFQVWGRVGYNPGVSSEIWEREFQRRFGERTGIYLAKALHLASRVLPRIVASSYRYRWFPTTRGWAEMNPMDTLPEYLDEEGSDIAQFMNVRDEAKSRIDGTDTAMRRPAENSRWFAEISDRILDLVEQAEAAAPNPADRELVTTLTDLRILAHLARYHSQRLLAGVQYALYKETEDLFSFDEALRHERRAVGAWAELVEAAGAVYRDDLAFGVERVGFARHWKFELAKLQDGLKKLEEERQEVESKPAGGGLRIAHVPLRRAGLEDTLRIRATILAEGEPAEARVLVRDPNGSSDSVPLRKVAAGMYEAVIPNPGYESTISYTIEVSGSGGQTAVYPLQGKDQPIHLVITGDPRPPSVRLERARLAHPGKDLPVYALAEDRSGIKSMRLRYRHLTQFEDYRSEEMLLNKETGMFQARIPGDFITPQWDLIYYLEAIDKWGNGRIYPDLDHEAPYVVVQTQR